MNAPSASTTPPEPTEGDEKKKLFCIFAEKWYRDWRGRVMWKPLRKPIYLHAKDTANARFIYRTTDMQMLTRITVCGEVIGYLGDHNGENLEA